MRVDETRPLLVCRPTVERTISNVASNTNLSWNLLLGVQVTFAHNSFLRHTLV